MIHSIEHAGAVLDLFSAERPEWGASTVAGALGVSKSGAHYILVSRLPSVCCGACGRVTIASAGGRWK
jgi:hypothetical protein